MQQRGAGAAIAFDTEVLGHGVAGTQRKFKLCIISDGGAAQGVA